MVHKLSIQEKKEHASCMCRRAVRLAVGTTNGKVKIWQYCGTSFNHQCSWDGKLGPIGGIWRVDFSEKYLIVHVMKADYLNCVYVKDLNGQHMRFISSQQGMHSAALDGNYVIT